jgi:hypothetical protein
MCMFSVSMLHDNYYQRVCGVIGSFFGSIFGGTTDARTAPRQPPHQQQQARGLGLGGVGGGIELPTRHRHGGAERGGGGGAYGGLVEPSEANISNLMVRTPHYCQLQARSCYLLNICNISCMRIGPGVRPAGLRGRAAGHQRSRGGRRQHPAERRQIGCIHVCI